MFLFRNKKIKFSLRTLNNDVFRILLSNIYLVVCLLYLQVHKIIGFAPVLLQVVMEDTIDMPVRQAGIYIENTFIWPSLNVRVPTSSGNHGKPGKSLKKSSMHGKIMEFEKNLNNHGKIMEFCEVI